MATVTVVVTYTPYSAASATAMNEAKVTSFTYGGTAFASLTAANLSNAQAIIEQLPAVLKQGSDATGRNAYFSQGSIQPAS